jgi:hypothetical protein
LLTRHVSSYKRRYRRINFTALFNERAVRNYSGKSVGPRAGLLKSHSPWKILWYRRILVQTYTCRQAQESEINFTTAFSSRERWGLVNRFGNGAEKARKPEITATKPDAMAARKKDKEENEVYLFTLDDPQQNEDERGSFQPLLKTNSEAAERNPSRTANVLRRLDERWTDGVENRSRWLARARSSSAPGPASPGPASLCLWNGYQAAERVLRVGLDSDAGIFVNLLHSSSRRGLAAAIPEECALHQGSADPPSAHLY